MFWFGPVLIRFRRQPFQLPPARLARLSHPAQLNTEIAFLSEKEKGKKKLRMCREFGGVKQHQQR
jgi:hypothetical protein